MKMDDSDGGDAGDGGGTSPLFVCVKGENKTEI